MNKFTYKIESCEPSSSADYAVRYNPSSLEAYAKMRGGSEFKTDFKKNNTAYEVSLGGKEVSEKEYESF
jgi:hypothetical protein